MRQIRSHAGLRGLAALLVVGYHLQLNGGTLPVAALSDFLRRSYLMVDLFFVLSGFIICYVNAGDRPVAMPVAEAKDFYLRRLIRLVPLHVFALAALAGFTALVVLAFASVGRTANWLWWDDGPAKLLAQLLLVGVWVPGGTTWNIPTWSISAEIVAYFLFPLFVAARVGAPFLAQIAMLAGSLAFYIAVGSHGGSLDIVSGTAPLRCLAGFSLGCLIYLHRDRVAALPAGLLTGLLGAALIAIPTLMIVQRNDVWLMPFFCVLVACSWTDVGPVARLLGSGPLLRLGDISYSVYLMHVPVIAMLEFGWVRVADRLPLSAEVRDLAWLLLCYAVVLLVSRWTFDHVETGSRQYLSRWLRHRSARPIEQAAPAP